MSRKSIYFCDNCGADIVFNLTETVKTCSYCGGVFAIVDDDIYDKNITSIIPFEVSFDEAVNAVKNNGGIYASHDYYDGNVEKVFLPFSDIEFDFVGLASCEEIRENYEIYYDIFIEGKVDNYFSLCTNMVSNYDIVFNEFIKKDKIVKYDPSITNNCKVVIGNFNRIDKMVDSAAKMFCEKVICSKNGITKVDNLSSCEYNVKIKNTLVPFYKVSLSDNRNVYILAQDISKIEKNPEKKSRNKVMLILTCLVVGTMIIVLIDLNQKSKYGVSYVSGLFPLCFLSIFFMLFYLVFFHKPKIREGKYKMKKNRKTKLLGKYIDIFK